MGLIGGILGGGGGGGGSPPPPPEPEPEAPPSNPPPSNPPPSDPPPAQGSGGQQASAAATGADGRRVVSSEARSDAVRSGERNRAGADRSSGQSVDARGLDSLDEIRSRQPVRRMEPSSASAVLEAQSQASDRAKSPEGVSAQPPVALQQILQQFVNDAQARAGQSRALQYNTLG